MSTTTPPRSAARLVAPPGVYRPQDDTRLLIGALRRESLDARSEVFDMGTGSGALAIEAARLGARVTAVDIAWRAVLTARYNAWRAGHRISVGRGDLTAAPAGATYDLIVSNPPYVPCPDDRLPERGAARAWDAGRNGRSLLDRVCEAAPPLLRPGGALLMVHSSLCGTEATLEALAARGLRPAVVDRALVAFGPVMRGRLDWLRAEGLLGIDEDKEELVVIRAERV